MENLDNTPTREMNQKQWDQFRKRWINEWASGLIVECGMDEVSAKEVADIRFEDCVGCEGFAGRDERIYDKRCR
jgi:hypothetical protein|tara:strand:- start:67 stop:288 length:222 start_codon:yes stop_codon:yes gene_type:complete